MLLGSARRGRQDARRIALAAAQEEYERRRDDDGLALGEDARTEILALATDFPRLWHDVRSPLRERS
jgi:hypothetical protein